MLHSINPSYIEDYTLLEDKSEPPSVFHLGMLPQFVQAYIQDKYANFTRPLPVKEGQPVPEVDPEENPVVFYQRLVDYCRFGLKGWDNFDIQFETAQMKLPKIGKFTVVTDDCLAHLKQSWIVELGLKLYAINNLDETQRKNS